jgi:hypothetical protein
LSRIRRRRLVVREAVNFGLWIKMASCNLFWSQLPSTLWLCGVRGLIPR